MMATSGNFSSPATSLSTSALPVTPQVGGDRLAQGRNAVRRRVAVMAVAQRLDRRLDDEVRGAEIRLADAEIDDVAALRDQGIGTGEHREGVFLTDAVESRDGFQHGLSPRRRYREGDLANARCEFARSSPDWARKIKPGAGSRQALRNGVG